MDEQPNSMPHDSTTDEDTAEIEVRTVSSDEQDNDEQDNDEQDEVAHADVVPTEVASSEAVPATTHRANKKSERPFRVKLRGSVLVLVRLPNKRDIRAAFHQLSVTGGVVHLEQPLDEKLGVEMIFHIGGATVREKAQMLFPMWATQGWMQPFRFIEMSDASRHALDVHLKEFMGEPAKAKGAAAGA